MLALDTSTEFYSSLFCPGLDESALQTALPGRVFYTYLDIGIETDAAGIGIPESSISVRYRSFPTSD
jgi:hypothetical protein